MLLGFEPGLSGPLQLLLLQPETLSPNRYVVETPPHSELKGQGGLASPFKVPPVSVSSTSPWTVVGHAILSTS